MTVANEDSFAHITGVFFFIYLAFTDISLVFLNKKKNGAFFGKSLKFLSHMIVYLFF